MTRVNCAIERLEKGLPIFGTTVAEVSYDGGRAAAGHWADWLVVEMEHRPFDIPALAAFMRGYAEVRRSKAGDRAPAISVTLPLDGTEAAAVYAGSWMVKQVLATGVHGLMLCHAENPGAARAFVGLVRYATRAGDPDRGIPQGRRGHGGQDAAAAIWGLSAPDYISRADIWPLDPAGELFVGLKIENPRALANAEATLAVPGVTCAEWGPADMAMAYGCPGDYGAPRLLAARARVKAACDASGVRFLNSARPDNVAEIIDEGTRFIVGSRETALAGRAYLEARPAG